MRPSTFVASLFSLCLLAPVAIVGCASDTSDDAENGESDNALTSSAQPIVGQYADNHVPSGGIARLTLSANGKYDAQVDAGSRAMCITAPCWIPEHGTWNATKGTGGKLKLRLRATGEASRYYDAQHTNGSLVISRSGQTQTLTLLAQCGGFAGLRCSANEECVDDPTDSCDPTNGGADCMGVCQPKATTPAQACGGIGALPCGAGDVCVDDPTDSCDPANNGRDCIGICQPKSTACAGAWKDQNGNCRTPADGVYPAACCAGQ